jgi:molybdopterin molybdotransferase
VSGFTTKLDYPIILQDDKTRVRPHNSGMAEVDVSDLMTVQQAMAIIDSVPVHPRTARDEPEKCWGCYLAEDVLADRDSPPFDKSLMDGFAVRSADVQTIPCELEVMGRIAAGGSPAVPVGERQAIAIMTGAPLPENADAVVPIEMTKPAGVPNRITVQRSAKPGDSIARRGSEAAAGSVVIKEGTRLKSTQLAVAQSVGAYPLVYDLASVGIIETGDELVPKNQKPTGSQIRACNSQLLLGALTYLPCFARTLENLPVPDDPDLIEQSILSAFARQPLDILLITGGMSMGERDFVPAVLKNLGADLKITKLRIKPGKPFIFAQMPDGKYVFGLPGNPVSAFVCTRILVSRLIRRIAGGPADEPTRVAPLAAPVKANGPRTFYLPAIFDGQALTPLKWKGSADIFTLSRANALLILAENLSRQPAGAALEFVELDNG